MDETHVEMWTLWQTALDCDARELAGVFGHLACHCRTHFEREEALMRQHGFPAFAEHRDDHQRLLGEVDHFARRLADGRALMARQWLSERLPAWFETHLRNMDSALAAHLKKLGVVGRSARLMGATRFVHPIRLSHRPAFRSV